MGNVIKNHKICLLGLFFYCFCCCLLIFNKQAHAATKQSPADTLFLTATQHQQTGNYKQAETEYQQLLALGIAHHAVEYHLGMLNWQTQQKALALVHLLRSDLLHHTPQAQLGIQTLREEFLKQPNEYVNNLKPIGMSHELALSLWRLPVLKISGITGFLGVVFLIIYLVTTKSRSRTMLGILSTCCVLLCLAALFMNLWCEYLLHAEQPAVVTLKCVLKNGPDDRYGTLGELNPGQEIIATDKQGQGYIGILLQGNQQASIEARCIEILTNPYLASSEPNKNAILQAP